VMRLGRKEVDLPSFEVDEIARHFGELA